MLKNILTGQIRPTQIFLAPEGAGGAGGAGSADPGADDIQIPDEFKVDFGDFDPDLLDEKSREAWDKGQENLQRMQKLAAKLAKGGDTTALQNEIQQLRQQLQGQQQQKKTDEPETIEDKLAAHYRAVGVPEANIPGMVKLNAPMFRDMEARTAEHINGTLAPLHQKIQNQTAATAFEEVTGNDPRFQIPEVSQAIWDKTQAFIKAGVEVDEKVLLNVGRIAYMELMDDPKMAEKYATLPQKQFNTGGNMFTSTRTIPTTTTRHTYPGAGSHVQQPTKGQRSGIDDLDPDTRAAVTAVTNGMRSWTTPGVPKPPKRA